MNRRRRWSGGRDHVDAAGEYVSAQSQADNADLKRETTELKTDNQGEHKELAAIYVARGLNPRGLNHRVRPIARKTDRPAN